MKTAATANKRKPKFEVRKFYYWCTACNGKVKSEDGETCDCCNNDVLMYLEPKDNGTENN